MKPILLTILGLALCLTTMAQAIPGSNPFLPGHYYKKDGTRVKGLLRHTYGNTFGDGSDNFIDFKPAQQDSMQRFTVFDIQHFVIGPDSFTVKRNFAINDYEQYAQDFVQVIQHGSLNLYLHYSTKAQRNVLTYLVEKYDELYQMAKPSHFQDQFIILIAENKELLKKVKAKEYRLEQLPTVVAAYNQWHTQRTPQP
jgi:hypothetical protein